MDKDSSVASLYLISFYLMGESKIHDAYKYKEIYLTARKALITEL